MGLEKIRKTFLNLDRIDVSFIVIIFISVFIDILTTFIGMECYGEQEQNPLAKFIFETFNYPLDYIINFAVYSSIYNVTYLVMASLLKWKSQVAVHRKVRLILGTAFVLGYGYLGWIRNAIYLVWLISTSGIGC